MKSLNTAGKRPFVSGFFLSSLMIGFLALGTSCGGGSQNNNPGGNQATPMPTPVPTPAADPILAAQTNFKDKVWGPFFQTNRCNNCHDFDNLHPLFYTGHPDKTATCTGCHSAALLGFGPPDWKPTPDADKWNKLSDPNTVRAHILTAGPTTGANLYKHLLGEGVDKAPLVQWAFFNGPDTGPGAGQIHAGKVPMGFAGQEHPTGQIPAVEPDLLDWNKFKTAVQEWMCLEAKIPGSPSLGLPPTVVCP